MGVEGRATHLAFDGILASLQSKMVTAFSVIVPYCLNQLGRNDEADKDFKKAEELGRK